MEYEVIIRDESGEVVAQHVVPETYLVAVIEVNRLQGSDGWRKRKLLWGNIDEDKKRMREHSTF